MAIPGKTLLQGYLINNEDPFKQQKDIKAQLIKLILKKWNKTSSHKFPQYSTYEKSYIFRECDSEFRPVISLKTEKINSQWTALKCKTLGRK